MASRVPNVWTRVGTAACAGMLALGLGGRLLAPALGQVAGPPRSFGSGIRDGLDKVTSAVSPKKAPAEEPVAVDDPLSLRSESKPSSGLYVAVARLYERVGKLAEAEKNYQLALKEKPNDLTALLGYARLQEQMERPDEAVKLYQRAAKAHPKEASVLNNLGLCYARQGKLDEAVVALGRAVLLQPKNALYRNNAATVLVELGRMQEAYSHLRSVHGNAAAYYNLGYLLNKKGKKQEAMHHFAIAARLDPTLVQAKHWLERLQREAEPGRAAQSVAGSPPPAPAGPTPANGPSAPLHEQIRIGTRPMLAAPPTAPPREPPPREPPVREETAGKVGPVFDSGTAPSAPRLPEEGAGLRRGPPPSEAPPLPPEPSRPTRLPPISVNIAPADGSRPSAGVPAAPPVPRWLDAGGGRPRDGNSLRAVPPPTHPNSPPVLRPLPRVE